MRSLEDAAPASCQAQPVLPACCDPRGGSVLKHHEPLTVRELVALYLHYRGPELHPRSLTLSKRSLGAFAETFGERPCVSLARRELIVWLRDMECWAAAATKKGALNRIKAAFGWAIKEGDLLTSHPF